VSERLASLPEPRVALAVGGVEVPEIAPAAIELRLHETDDGLHLAWSFDEEVVDRREVESLAEETRGALAWIAADAEAAAVSPTDFPEADLDADDLEKVLSKLRG
jgi:hypothetical protein